MQTSNHFAKSNLGQFPTFPSAMTRENFRAWVIATGRPDLWQFHDASSPPKDGPLEIVLDFGIPEHLRAAVGRATCPICSPMAPKYFDGALAWFPNEGVLRAIGHECAKSHFGERVVVAAIAKGKHRDAVEAAQDYLIDTLPKVAGYRAEVEALRLVASDIDHLRRAMWQRLGKADCERASRLGARGVLHIEAQRAVESVDRYGKQETVYEPLLVASYSVAGMNFLRRRFLLSALVTNTLESLSKVHASDPEAALEFVAENLRRDDDLFEAEALAKGATAALLELRDAVAEAVAFTSPANLAKLSEWTYHELSEAPFLLRYNNETPARFVGRRHGAAEHNFPIPASIASLWRTPQ